MVTARKRESPAVARKDAVQHILYLLHRITDLLGHSRSIIFVSFKMVYATSYY